MTRARVRRWISLDRAPGRFADNLFVRRNAKADVLLTTIMGLLRHCPDILLQKTPALAHRPLCVQLGPTDDWQVCSHRT